MLRDQHHDYGLPYVYNVDEGSHFTSRAVGMFGGDADPGYFQNPSAFTYLVHLALRLRFGGGEPFGTFDGVIEHFKLDPTGIYDDHARARRRSSCMVGVVAVYSVGRRAVGPADAASSPRRCSAFAFLPVTTRGSRVTDVGDARARSRSCCCAPCGLGGRARCAGAPAAGAAAGLAVGFKYTAGLVLLAAARRRWRCGRDAARRAGAAAGVGSLVVGGRASSRSSSRTRTSSSTSRTPHRQLSAQADAAGDFGKVGQDGDAAPPTTWAP